MLKALQDSGRDLLHCSHGKMWADECSECDVVWEDQMANPRLKQDKARIATLEAELLAARDLLAKEREACAALCELNSTKWDEIGWDGGCDTCENCLILFSFPFG
jgi:hypothetical protein